MVRGRISQGNGKPNKFNSSDFIKELENNDDDSSTSSLPRGGSKKTYSLPSSKVSPILELKIQLRNTY